MDKGKKRKNKKNYYIQAAKKQKTEHKLNPGQKGFLISCNGNEGQAVKESYNLLNEYADQLYGDEHEFTHKMVSSKEQDNAKSETECDVEDELKSELDSIKNKVKNKQFRFRQVKSGAKNILFIRIDTDYDPNELIDVVYKDVEESGNPKSRALAKVIPVIKTCNANMDNIKAEFSKLAKEYFENDENLNYQILFKIRNSNCIVKTVLIKEISQIMSSLNKGHHFDYSCTDVVLNFEVIKSVCCISILRNYSRFRKYNIQEVAKSAKSKKATTDKSVECPVDVDEEPDDNPSNEDNSDTEEQDGEKHDDDDSHEDIDCEQKKEINKTDAGKPDQGQPDEYQTTCDVYDEDLHKDVNCEPKDKIDKIGNETLEQHDQYETPNNIDEGGLAENEDCNKTDQTDKSISVEPDHGDQHG